MILAPWLMILIAELVLRRVASDRGPKYSGS